METTDFLRTTVAAVAISVAFLGSNETATARPYHHVFSCYDFAWQSQDLKDCLAGHEDAAQRPSASAKTQEPLQAAASARVPWKQAVAATPYRHVFSCYDFAWQSRDMKDCLAALPLSPERPVAAAKPAAASVAAAAKPLPIAGHPAHSLASRAPQHHAAPQIAQSHPHSVKHAAAAPHAPAPAVAIASAPTNPALIHAPAKTAVAAAKAERPAPRQLVLPLPPVTKAPATAVAAKAAPLREPRHEATAQAKPQPHYAPPTELVTAKPAAPKVEKAAAHPVVAAKEHAPKEPRHEATAQAKPQPRHAPPAELVTAKPAAHPAVAARETAPKEPQHEATVQAKPQVPHTPPAELATAKPAAPKAGKREPRPAVAAKVAPKEPRHEAITAAKPLPRHVPPANLAATKPPVPTRAASAKPEPRHPAAPKPVETVAKQPPEAPVAAAPRTPVFASPMAPSVSPALPQILRGVAPQDTASAPRPRDAGGSPDTIAPAAGRTRVLRPGEVEQGPSGHVTIENTPDGVEVIRGQVDHGN